MCRHTCAKKIDLRYNGTLFGAWKTSVLISMHVLSMCRYTVNMRVEGGSVEKIEG